MQVMQARDALWGTRHSDGIAERMAQLSEDQGHLIGEVIRRILGALNLTPEQKRLVATVVPRELRAITGGDREAESESETK